jgi:hypothetical protein
MGEMKHKYKFGIGKPEGKRILERHKRRWEDYIKVDRKEEECQSMD